MIIHKAKETMTAKERVLKTFNLEKTDRVTIGYEANDAVNRRVASALGIIDGNIELVMQALGVDYRGVGATYNGPMLFKTLTDRKTNEVDGFNMRWVQHQTGGYWDFCDFPLMNADDETIANFPVPNPDDFDYKAVTKQIAANNDYAIYVGNPGIPDIINSTGRIMGMEDTLVNLLTENEATLSFVNRRMDMYLSVLERILDSNRGKIDFMWLGEDLGTQNAPMIGIEMYREVLKPIHKRFADLAKAYKLPILVHTCGSSSWAYEDFIDMGIHGVDTLQPEAKNMSPEYLKEHFGGRLSFRGCISTAGPLAYGSVDDVSADVKKTLSIMMKGYGYHFAPTHAIQDNTPTENVIAMYQAAHKFGNY
ncbi:MAG TPA: uroporphyrinogen decarboxylase family protein [Ruminiclostridium sp.]